MSSGDEPQRMGYRGATWTSATGTTRSARLPTG